MAVGVTGAVAPVQIYTSYDSAPAAVFQVSTAVEAEAIVAALAGEILLVQVGTVGPAKPGGNNCDLGTMALGVLALDQYNFVTASPVFS